MISKITDITVKKWHYGSSEGIEITFQYYNGIYRVMKPHLSLIMSGEGSKWLQVGSTDLYPMAVALGLLRKKRDGQYEIVGQESPVIRISFQDDGSVLYSRYNHAAETYDAIAVAVATSLLTQRGAMVEVVVNDSAGFWESRGVMEKMK